MSVDEFIVNAADVFLEQVCIHSVVACEVPLWPVEAPQRRGRT